MKVDRESTGYKIFKKIFHCRVKAKHLLDIERVSEYGHATTGDDEYDAELAETYNDVYLPTSTIAELIGDGVDVQMVVHDDAVTMYNLIMAHMEWWEEKFRTSLYIDPERLKRVKADLELFAKLSDALYPSVRSFVTKSHQHLTNRPDSVMPFSPNSNEYTLDDTDVGRWDLGEVAPHRTLEDVIGAKALDRVRPWERRK
jgi:hypothetical protein